MCIVSTTRVSLSFSLDIYSIGCFKVMRIGFHIMWLSFLECKITGFVQSN